MFSKMRMPGTIWPGMVLSFAISGPALFAGSPVFAKGEFSLSDANWKVVKKTSYGLFSFAKRSNKITASYERQGYVRKEVVCHYLKVDNYIRASYFLSDFPIGQSKANAVFTGELYLSASRDQIIFKLVRIAYVDKKTHKKWMSYPKNSYLAFDFVGEK